ncbi:MAG: Na+/H+ antiporter NhaC family protein [Bacteroidales bacterium]
MKKSYLFLTLLLLVLGCPAMAHTTSADSIPRLSNDNLKIVIPDIIMQDLKTPITLEVTDPDLKYLVNGEYQVTINGSGQTILFDNGMAEFNGVFKNRGEVSIRLHDYEFSRFVTPIPMWLSVLPPLIAIAMALIFKEVYSALFIGILVGTFIIFYYQGQGIFEALFNGFFAVIDTYILESMQESSHLSIIIFSMMIGGMVGVITKNGGMRGVVNYLSRFAGNARSGQLVTWVMGIMIFFDDYANTLVVGNTMRPVTDRLKISREKLAYLVDSTAAPIASIAFVTTWIGAELSYIQNGIKTLGLPETPYDVFINSLQYSFYPILALIFILFLVWQRRDFGPMFKAEYQARTSKHITGAGPGETGESELDKVKPTPGYNALVPVLVVVLGTIAGLIITGLDVVGWDTARSISGNLSRVIGNSDSFSALLWSSLAGVTVAIFMSVVQRILSLRTSIDALVKGFQTMLTAVLILVLAWSIAMITEHLHTAEFISNSMVALKFSPYLVPALTFVLAALVAFSTGSSWGTMAILYPLILPASWLICQNHGLDYDTSISIFHNVVSAVLAGSVLGDHCSPISDTTILSSLASSCNHIDHVRTQMPYALTVGFTGLVFGTVPAAYGVSTFILFPLNLLLLLIIIRIAGKKLPKVSIR